MIRNPPSGPCLPPYLYNVYIRFSFFFLFFFLAGNKKISLRSIGASILFIYLFNLVGRLSGLRVLQAKIFLGGTRPTLLNFTYLLDRLATIIHHHHHHNRSVLPLTV